MNVITSIERALAAKDFTPARKGALRGFARIALRRAIIQGDVSICAKGERAWAMPASKPMMGRNGAIVRCSAGEIRYASIVTVECRAPRHRFGNAVSGAMRAALQGALQ